MSDGSELVPSKSINDHPDLTPPQDSLFADLLKSAVDGETPVYFAALPLRLIKPFSNVYNPRNHPVGRQAISEIQAQWANGQFAPMFVYLQDGAFIMSDDYTIYYASLEGAPDYVPCWVLGPCTSPEACDVQGPIRKEDVRKLVFGSDD